MKKEILICLGIFSILSGCATSPVTTKFGAHWFFTEKVEIKNEDGSVEERQCVETKKINSHHQKVCLNEYDVKELRELLVRCRNR